VELHDMSGERLRNDGFFRRAMCAKRGLWMADDRCGRIIRRRDRIKRGDSGKTGAPDDRVGALPTPLSRPRYLRWPRRSLRRILRLWIQTRFQCQRLWSYYSGAWWAHGSVRLPVKQLSFFIILISLKSNWSSMFFFFF
jgi:hypothetical protein